MKFKIDDIPHWCAAVKVSHIYHPRDYTKSDHEELIKHVAREDHGTILISVNWNDRKSLIPHLEKFGYKTSRWVRNWGHGGRKTCLMYRDIKLSEYKKHNPIRYRSVKNWMKNREQGE